MSRRRAIFIASLIFAAAIAAVIAIYPKNGLDFSQLFPETKVVPGFYKVTKVYDGDTIAVDMNGKTEKIRFIGVDTPETHDPNTPPQCYGQEASTFTDTLLKQANYSVRLEADPTGDNRDRYDRLLRYIYLPDGALLEQAIIEGGYGFAYTSFPFQKKKDFEEYQAAAEQGGKGLWTACTPTLIKGRWHTQSLTP